MCEPSPFRESEFLGERSLLELVPSIKYFFELVPSINMTRPSNHTQKR